MSVPLDYEEKPMKIDSRSMKSLRYFIYSVVAMMIVLLLFTLNHDADLRHLMFVFVVLGFIFIVSSFFGIKNLIQSIINKEDWTVIKIMALVGNLLTFSIAVGLIVFIVYDMFLSI